MIPFVRLWYICATIEHLVIWCNIIKSLSDLFGETLSLSELCTLVVLYCITIDSRFHSPLENEIFNNVFKFLNNWKMEQMACHWVC